MVYVLIRLLQMCYEHVCDFVLIILITFLVFFKLFLPVYITQTWLHSQSSLSSTQTPNTSSNINNIVFIQKWHLILFLSNNKCIHYIYQTHTTFRNRIIPWISMKHRLKRGNHMVATCQHGNTDQSESAPHDYISQPDWYIQFIENILIVKTFKKTLDLPQPKQIIMLKLNYCHNCSCITSLCDSVYIN